MLLSVIIPAYNVEDTLTRCVESVLRQELDNMEVILVDDGSTDGTAKLCDEYGKDPRITVVHQENAGLSEARNTGIRLSKGGLITFVDSDDYVEPGSYKSLVNLIDHHPQYDILEYEVVKEDGKKVLFRTNYADREYTDMAEYWIDGRAYAHTYAWNKIFRRHLFRKVRFPRGKKFEDVYTLSLVLKEANTVRVTGRGLYHYTYNRKGITVGADADAWRDLLKANLPMIGDKRLQEYRGFADYYAHVLNIQISTYENSGKEKDILLPTLPYDQNFKLKLLQFLGMKPLCKLFYLKYRLFGR